MSLLFRTLRVQVQHAAIDKILTYLFQPKSVVYTPIQFYHIRL